MNLEEYKKTVKKAKEVFLKKHQEAFEEYDKVEREAWTRHLEFCKKIDDMYESDDVESEVMGGEKW